MVTNLILLAVLLALVGGLRYFVRANPKLMARHLRTFGAVLALALAALSASRGAVTLALPLGLLAAWLLWSPRGAGSATPHAGQSSRIATDHLQVELDHDSGRMTGQVLRGMFAGRRIETLKPAELALLWQDCRFVDPKSAQIVQTYLDKVHPSWQADMARGEAEMGDGPDGKMSEKEALEILGLQPGASEDEIRRAHRELMMRFHPDRGGSTYLASKINEAKTVLLQE